MPNEPGEDQALLARLGEIRTEIKKLEAERKRIMRELSRRGHSRASIARAAGYKSATSVQRIVRGSRS